MNRLQLTPSTFLILLALVVTLAGAELVLPHPSAPLRLETAAHVTTPDLLPETTPQPRVTVNGEAVDLGTSGSATVNLPSGQAHIQSGGGSTTVTTTDGAGSSTNVVAGDGLLNVNVQSDTHGSTTVSSAQLESSASGASWSSSFSSSSQTVMGTGQGTVHIDQP